MANEETTYEASFDESNDREFPRADWGDTHTEVRHQSYFQRIMNSFAGVILGIAMFFGSFGLLYWNEGRVDLSTVVRKAVEMQAAAPSARGVGKLVAATGTLAAGPALGDGYLRPGPYAALRRQAEMYAWEEESHDRTEKTSGGGERTVTTYSYKRIWTDRPDVAHRFKKPGYRNPDKKVASADLKAKYGKVGVIPLDMSSVGLPAYKPVPLSNANTSEGRVSLNRLYLGNADPLFPKVGDTRLSYSAVPIGGKVTLVGQMSTPGQVGMYVHTSGDTIYRAFTGNKAAAVRELHKEFVLWTWVWRGVGFMLMWLGMRAVLEPLSVVLDIFPFLGDLGRGLTGAATFVVAVVLAVVTIVVAQVMHNLIAMIVIGVMVVVGGVLLFGKKRALTRKVRRVKRA